MDQHPILNLNLWSGVSLARSWFLRIQIGAERVTRLSTTWNFQHRLGLGLSLGLGLGVGFGLGLRL
jgi:hypothetical protein